MFAWLLPLGMKLSSAFKAGKAWVVEKHRLGLTPRKEELKMFVLMELGQRNLPTVNGKSIIGPEELDHFASGLVGIIFKYLDAEANEEKIVATY